MLRTAMMHPGVEIVAVNDPFVDAGAHNAYLYRPPCAAPRALWGRSYAPALISCCCSPLHAHPPSQLAEYMAYMLKYDSVHGRFPHEIHGDDSGLYIDGRRVAVHAKL